MRTYLTALAAAAIVASIALPAPVANAATVGAAPGLQRALDEISPLRKVVRICHRNMRTGRRVCWIDRSRPPTVCHVVRERGGARRVDCY
jgi:hypothetical protein